MSASVRLPVFLMAAASSFLLQQGSASAAEHCLPPELNSISLVHGSIEFPWEAMKQLFHLSTHIYSHDVKTRPVCFQMQLHTNQHKAEQKQCVQLADSATSVDFQLTLPTSDPAGPGQLTVALEHTRFQSSKYFHLTGLATKIDMYMSKHQPSHTKQPLSASIQQEIQPLLTVTVPSPLLHGAAIQLRAFWFGQMTDLPYYAVSEELLDNILLGMRFKKGLPPQTPYASSLHAKSCPELADMLLCPATCGRRNEQYQHETSTQSHRHLPEWQGLMLKAHIEQQSTPFAWLPWGTSLCLLLCVIALLVNNRQRAVRHAAAQHHRPVAQTATEHEASFVKSNWPGSGPTPTVDTGSSPFVPVTHFQAPVPQWPVNTAHLASCSSKIGSCKQKARPATSKAVTNLTSNISGATKWQRNKNGRLLSLALDPDELNS